LLHSNKSSISSSSPLAKLLGILVVALAPPAVAIRGMLPEPLEILPPLGMLSISLNGGGDGRLPSVEPGENNPGYSQGMEVSGLCGWLLNGL